MVDTAYGYELVLDLRDCDPATFTEANVQRFCGELCELIDMNPEDFHVWASDPKEYDTDPEHLHGVSAVQFITTSSIVIHTLTKMRRVYLNVFSCKLFEASDAKIFAMKFFGGKAFNAHLITRH